MNTALAFRITVPKVTEYVGIFQNQQAAVEDAERRYPNAWAVMTVCLSR